MVDYGILFGSVGIVVALASATYARAQATATRRQADAEAHLARVEVSRALGDRVRHVRALLLANPDATKEYLESNPALAAAFAEAGGMNAVVLLRDLLDYMQEVFFLREERIVSDHDWRLWATSMVPFTRMPSFRRVFENARARGALEPRFVQFMDAFFAGRLPDDPLGRVAWPRADAAAPAAAEA